MVNFKSKIKNNQITVKAKISSDEELSFREMEIFNKTYLRGFLKPTQPKPRQLEYTGPQGIPLSQYIKKPLSQYEFYYIMAQIVDTVRRIEANKLFLKNLVLDLRYVFINETTKELQFIYLPLMSNHICVDIIGFMESIIYGAMFDQTKGTDYVARYVNFLRNIDGFSVEGIEAFLSKQDTDIAQQIKKQNVVQSGFITNKKVSSNMKDENQGTSLLEEDEGTSLLDEGGTSLLDEGGGTSLLEEEGGTSLLDENDYTANKTDNNVRFPYLIRVSTNEKVLINKLVFRLGKEKSYVDYFISNNNAISRSHADIVTRVNRYFVIDHNSTNKTYINGMVVPIKVETEIFHGNILKLANEEFQFHIE